MDYKTITDKLRLSGYRLTTPRSEVIKALCEATSYVGAYDIHNTLKDRGINVGVASIYRVFELLCSLGMLKREEFGSSSDKFKLTQGGHTHQLICSNCGSAREFGNCGITTLAANLEHTSGYKIQDHWLRFFGLCPKCQDHCS